MAKTLDELLSQKQFTGREAGLIHLYSVENDISSALKGQKPKKLYSQAFFDKVISKLSDTETANYQVYALINSVVFEIAKISQTYLKEISSCYNKIFLTFSEINRAEQTMEILPRTQRNDVRDILYTADRYLSDKQTVAEIEASFRWFNKAYCFMNAANFVQSIIFKTFDIEFMNTVLYDMKKLDDKVNSLNEIYKTVTAPLAETKRNKFSKNIGIIDTVELMPDQKDYKLFEAKINIGSPDNCFFEAMGSISASILEIVNRVLERKGE